MTAPGSAPPPPPGPDPARLLAAARRTARAAQAVAIVAVVLAAVAVVVSLAALSNARSNGSTPVAGSAPTTTEADPPASAASTSSEPAATRSTPPDTETVRPEAEFEVHYERQPLRVSPEKGCEYRYVDLDEPRVGVSQTIAEFGYGGQCGDAKPEIDVLDDLQISDADDNFIARDCAEAIRRGPINEPVVPAPQSSLCLLTSASAAEKEGIERKMVLITIDNIAADGTMNLLVTAWNIPR